MKNTLKILIISILIGILVFGIIKTIGAETPNIYIPAQSHNLNVSPYNVSADYFHGKINSSNVQNVPDEWTSTYNSTYDTKVSDNSSWNESYGRDLFLENGTNIDMGDKNITSTGSFFSKFIGSMGNMVDWIWTKNITVQDTINATNYIGDGSLLTGINSSNYWDNLDTFNTTQMQNNNGILNILESWVSSLINSIVSFTNVAYTNQSNTFTTNQNFTKNISLQTNSHINFGGGFNICTNATGMYIGNVTC